MPSCVVFMSRLVPVLLCSLTPLALASPSGAVSPAVEAERMALPRAVGQPFLDATASARAGLLLRANGTASATVTAASAATRLVVRARGDQCGGAPRLRADVDGRPAASVSVTARNWTDYTVAGTWAAGRHRVRITFLNDVRRPRCDRNLRLDRLSLIGPGRTGPAVTASRPAPGTSGAPKPKPNPTASPGPTPTPTAAPAPTTPAPTPTPTTTTAAPAPSTTPAPTAPTVLEAEAMTLPSAAGQPFSDSGASGQAGLLVWSNGTAVGTLAASTPATGLVVRARGDQCAGAPSLQLTVDGVPAGTLNIADIAWTDYRVTGSWAAGEHRLELSYGNDHLESGCDRNLRLDRSGFTTATSSPPVLPASSANPFTGAKSYVDPQSAARREADLRRTADPAGAAALDKVASASAADWYGDWVATDALAATVRARVDQETSSGALPVLVAYDIPHRDCGGFSTGGAPSADAYRAWIGQLAAGIGDRKAVVVLEPDALALLDCLSSSDQSEREALLSEAVGVLASAPATTVYLDAGHAGWQSATTMAARLTASGAARARGFSLNVSNFDTAASELGYGDDIVGHLGGGHFLIDSSRNGLGPGSTWCNPAGRALGERMTTATADARADAFTWVKAPGESDGTCGGGPPAGQFWTDYAIGLGARAAY